MKCVNCNINYALISIDLPEVRYISIDGIACPLHRDTVNGTYRFSFKCQKCGRIADVKIIGHTSAEEFYKSIINEPMKNVIEQIRKIKGVVTVEKSGENMAVVVFEPKPKRVAVECENQKQFEFVWSKTNEPSLNGTEFGSKCIMGDGRYTTIDLKKNEGMQDAEYFKQRKFNVIPFTKYIFDYDIVNEWSAFNKPKSLTPEELVDGRIYVDKSNGRIVRFNKIKNECTISLYSQKCMEGAYYNSINGCGKSYHYRGSFRLATPSEAQSLIIAEIEHGYFHELKDVK